MKILSRDFTFVEKIIILVLSVVALGLVYYFLVFEPVNSGIASANSQKEVLETELQVVNTKLDSLAEMEEELDGSNATYMLSYNGTKKETALLNDIFASASEYNISFNDVTRQGNQIRRNFYFSFKTTSYDTVQSIMKKIANSEYRCLINDCSMSNTNGTYSVSANATFFETMVDGKADAALPEDSAIAQDTTSTDETY